MKRFRFFAIIPLLLAPLPAPAQTDYSTGVFIVNEDWYGHQNSTVNYLDPDAPEGERWHYRVIQQENPGMELGCTNQFGAIWDGRFYFIAKQAKDPGASVTGGRITVADASTMKILHQSELIDPSGSQCDGRGFVGIDSHKGYVSTSNGVWILDLDTYEIKGQVPGSANPGLDPDKPATDPSGSLYHGQSGTMLCTAGKVFVAHQKAGILVIDPAADRVESIISMDIAAENAGVGSVVLAKDGSVWASVAKDTGGSGASLAALVRIDPATLATEVIDLPEGVFGPSNSWYAWTPDTFCASAQTNTLYWSGGKNSWFTGAQIYRYDIDSRSAEKIIDLDADGEKWKLYGCSMRLHPETDEIYASLYHQFNTPVYITRRYTADGQKICDYPMIENYWFPSLPVFPQPTQGGSGVASVPGGGRLEIAGGTIMAHGLDGRRIDVFTLDGIAVASATASGERFVFAPALPAGLYIVRAAGMAKKFRI